MESKYDWDSVLVATLFIATATRHMRSLRCASVTGGPAITTPQRAAMKSRRFIHHPPKLLIGQHNAVEAIWERAKQ
jgi:hypothetical protein